MKQKSTKQEDRVLQDFHMWLRNTHPWTYQIAFHIENEKKRNAMQMMRALGKGMVAGLPDYWILLPTDKYHGLLLEFKIDDNTLSHKQESAKDRLISVGYQFQTVYGFEQAQKAFNDYLIFVKSEVILTLQQLPL